MNYFQACKMLPQLKRDFSWLAEINSQSLQQTLRKLDNAFTAFFRKNSAYPKFRSKKDNQYFIVPLNARIEGNRIIMPKFLKGMVFRDHFDTSQITNINQVIVTRDVERYYASILYETNAALDQAKGLMGIDLGIKHFITTSDGIQVEPLNSYRKMEKKLKREQRKLSRKKKGSNNRKKQIVNVQKIYQHIRDVRTDFNHKVSGVIAKHYGTVVIEDLNIQGMQRMSANIDIASSPFDVSKIKSVLLEITYIVQFLTYLLYS
ncbi:transposase [Ferroplasma sp.]|uniref:RNA-guided endonuclease InsQ/TnpB family protein n=1 Tax=Ferroplasma sp. TaxID=2591003 RepID=UPI00307F1041